LAEGVRRRSIIAAVLKSGWHGARGIATAIPDIEINSVAAAGYGIPATAISTTAVVFTAAIARIAITLTVIALPCRLLLWRKIAVWIAHSVTGTEIPAMAARRRMGISPVLDLLDKRFACVRRGSGRTHLECER